MNRYFKIFLITLCLVFAFFISLAVFIRFQGKNFIETQASAILHRPVTIGQAQFVFPSGVCLTDLNIEGLVFAPKAQVLCELVAFPGGNFRLAEVKLEAPVLTLHRGGDRQILWSKHGEAKSQVEPKRRNVTAAQHGIKAIIQKLIVIDGQVHFPSHEDQDSSDVSFQKVALTALNVPLSGQNVNVGFSMAGTIVDSENFLAGGHFKGKGILNWPKRDLDADFSVAKLQGNMDVEVHLASRNNDMMVTGHMKTGESPQNDRQQEANSNGGILMAAVQKAGMAIEMNFSFPMKMDRWEMRDVDFSGNLSASNDGKIGADKAQEIKNSGQ